MRVFFILIIMTHGQYFDLCIAIFVYSFKFYFENNWGGYHNLYSYKYVSARATYVNQNGTAKWNETKTKRQPIL